MTLNFKFLAYSLKNRHPGKHHCPFFTTKDSSLISVEGVKTLPIAK